jgi:uncharacterized membrane-anchored protein
MSDTRRIKAAITAALLLIPVAGLAAIWANTHRESKLGTDWDVPVRGYDPRDLLRGHYIEYEYDWPKLDGEIYGGETLCIAGKAPQISGVTILPYGDKDKEAVCGQIVRADSWSEEQGYSTRRDRLYIPQTKGVPLEVKLRDPNLQGIVRVRIRKDGIITPLSISFRPNPNPEPVQMGRAGDRLQPIDVAEETPPASVASPAPVAR